MNPESAADRVRTALDLLDVAEQMYRTRLRNQRPEITDVDLDDAIRVWFTTRPGAPFGDMPGAPSTRRL